MKGFVVLHLEKSGVRFQFLDIHLEDALFDQPHIVLSEEDVGSLDQTECEIDGYHLTVFLTSAKDSDGGSVCQRLLEIRRELTVIDYDY